MLQLLMRAAAAAGAALKNPALRAKALQAAQKAGDAVKGAARRSVQACQWWGRNRGIRAAYNARKLALKRELAAMRKAGASTRQMADKAYEFRRAERLRARELMRQNGDLKSVQKLEARDAAKYGKRGMGDKNGPNREGLQRETAQKLKERLGRDATEQEVDEAIIDSATRTDWKTNTLFLTW
jgi:hypothetical protein